MNFTFMDLQIRRPAEQYRKDIEKEFARTKCTIRKFQSYYKERLSTSSLSEASTDFENNLFYLNRYFNQVVTSLANIEKVLGSNLDEKFGIDVANESIARMYCFLDFYNTYIGNFFTEIETKTEKYFRFDAYAIGFSKLAIELNRLIDLLNLTELPKLGSFVKITNVDSNNRYMYA